MRENRPIRPLLTVWGEQLNRECPLNDYPRPQLARPQWQCLNGPWQYAIHGGDARPEVWDGEIVVPFSPESVLSGVGRRLMPGQTLWYKREVTFAAMPQKEERLLLHFGAVDQRCTVYVNGQQAGTHAGGYWPFSLDITGLVRKGENEITVAVADDTDQSDEAFGKQTLNRGEIWYTGQSGIWQTVWCETVPRQHIQSLRITPCWRSGEVEITALPAVEDEDLKGTVKVLDGATVVAKGALIGGTVRLALPGDFKSWSPDDPFLYDVEITAGKDEIRSYFGMREFGVSKGANSPRLTLNGRPILHNGLLDQGYWSDGMYTPPSDAAMVWDIEKAKAMGFNMLRKHIKIEPLRWYYHCDRLGMLVWQDFVSGGGPYSPMVVQVAPFVGVSFGDGPDRYALHGRESDAGRKNFMRDAERTIDLLYNVPSLAVWVPFNEGWGQFDAAYVADFVRQKDPTRAVDHASGYFDQGAGDFHSYHVYFKPFLPRRDKHGRVLALTEFGGYSLARAGHVSSDEPYGYKQFTDKKALNEAILRLYLHDVLPAMKLGLGAIVYTQVSDVEDETNGLFTYDRKITKVSPRLTRKLARLLDAAFRKNL